MFNTIYQEVSHHQNHFFNDFDSFLWCVSHHVLRYDVQGRFSESWMRGYTAYCDSRPRYQDQIIIHQYLTHYEYTTGDVLPILTLATYSEHNRMPESRTRLYAYLDTCTDDYATLRALFKNILKVSVDNKDDIARLVDDLLDYALSYSMLDKYEVWFELYACFFVQRYDAIDTASAVDMMIHKVMGYFMQEWNSYTLYQRLLWLNYIEHQTRYSELAQHMKTISPFSEKDIWTTWPDPTDETHLTVISHLIERHQPKENRYDNLGRFDECSWINLYIQARMKPNRLIGNIPSTWKKWLADHHSSLVQFYEARTLTYQELWSVIEPLKTIKGSVPIEEEILF